MQKAQRKTGTECIDTRHISPLNVIFRIFGDIQEHSCMHTPRLNHKLQYFMVIFTVYETLSFVLSFFTQKTRKASSR